MTQKCNGNCKRKTNTNRIAKVNTNPNTIATENAYVREPVKNVLADFVR